MGFSSFAPTSVSAVLFAFVDHGKLDWLKLGREFRFDDCLHTHAKFPI